jgi:hypothetical protein
MQRKSLSAAVALGVCALAVAAPAVASSGKPNGYVQVVGPAITIDAGQQLRATVACPAGKVPVGGGGLVASSDVRATMSSSLPLGNGWAVDVSNASDASTTASASVVCITQPRKYVVISVGDLHLAGSQTDSTAFCPTGTVVLGGGAEANAADLHVGLNSSFPLAGGNGWRISLNDGSPDNLFPTTFAICAAAPDGYAVVKGDAVRNRAGAEGSAFAACAGTAVPLGGGAASSANDLRVNIGSLRPEAHGWTSLEHNASSSAAALATRVVCAGA